jgi:ATPase subunit of ABC transporter with duplicated ATPase domains
VQTEVIEVVATTLSCCAVSIKAGRREVVAPFSWRHRAGGIAWLMGANGSGKSSVLRVLAGWQKPATGTVEWQFLPGARVSYYAPNMTEPPQLRVVDFIRFVGAARAETNRVELAVLQPVIPDHQLRCRSLSTGEAKRLLLWSLLRHNARPLILDEPYEHLSRDAKDALTVLLQRVADQSVVVVATNQDVPVRPQDSVLTLDRAALEITRAF